MILTCLRRPSFSRMTGSSSRVVPAMAILAAAVAFPPVAEGQAPDRVLVQSRDRGPTGLLAADQGMTALRQQLRKLGTTASVLYTAGHPDDEEAGVLTALSRGMGVRTGLLTLNRGEGGANAIGPELFDALGLIRTEELRLAGRYYGLDDQYFTTAIDYGYSKTLDEALRSWDQEAILGDMVRIIRLHRPLVVLSRWHGSARDGHGHHQATGVLTPLAVEAAADPTRFPGQIEHEGLRAWRVPKVYRDSTPRGGRVSTRTLFRLRSLDQPADLLQLRGPDDAGLVQGCTHSRPRSAAHFPAPNSHSRPDTRTLDPMPHIDRCVRRQMTRRSGSVTQSGRVPLPARRGFRATAGAP